MTLCVCVEGEGGEGRDHQQSWPCPSVSLLVHLCVIGPPEAQYVHGAPNPLRQSWVWLQNTGI